MGLTGRQCVKNTAFLLPYVGHRADLDYILNEIVAESNTGHTYVDWGNFDLVKRVDNGLLGAELTADETAGGYRIPKFTRVRTGIQPAVHLLLNRVSMSGRETTYKN